MDFPADALVLGFCAYAFCWWFCFCISSIFRVYSTMADV